MTAAAFSVVSPAAAVLTSPAASTVEQDVKDFHKAHPLANTQAMLAALMTMGHNVRENAVLEQVARAEGATGADVARWVADSRKLEALTNGNDDTPLVLYDLPSLASPLTQNGHDAVVEANAECKPNDSGDAGRQHHDSAQSRKAESEVIQFLERLRPSGPWVLTAILPDGPTTTSSRV